jgi:hypothetical protein
MNREELIDRKAGQIGETAMTLNSTVTLGDELPRQIARVRDEILPTYLEIGPSGAFAAAMMRADLDTASKAMIEGDVVAMLRVCKSLQEWES